MPPKHYSITQLVQGAWRRYSSAWAQPLTWPLSAVAAEVDTHLRIEKPHSPPTVKMHSALSPLPRRYKGQQGLAEDIGLPLLRLIGDVQKTDRGSGCRRQRGEGKWARTVHTNRWSSNHPDSNRSVCKTMGCIGAPPHWANIDCLCVRGPHQNMRRNSPPSQTHVQYHVSRLRHKYHDRHHAAIVDGVPLQRLGGDGNDEAEAPKQEHRGEARCLLAMCWHRRPIQCTERTKDNRLHGSSPSPGRYLPYRLTWPVTKERRDHTIPHPVDMQMVLSPPHTRTMVCWGEPKERVWQCRGC